MTKLEQKSQLSRARSHGFFEICRRSAPTLTGAVEAAEIYCRACGATILKGSPGATRIASICHACRPRRIT